VIELKYRSKINLIEVSLSSFCNEVERPDIAESSIFRHLIVCERDLKNVKILYKFEGEILQINQLLKTQTKFYQAIFSDFMTAKTS